MSDWRNDPATEKQKAYIAEMQEFSELPLPRFDGRTKGEACDYISTYSKTAHYTFDNIGHEDGFGDRA